MALLCSSFQLHQKILWSLNSLAALEAQEVVVVAEGAVAEVDAVEAAVAQAAVVVMP